MRPFEAIAAIFMFLSYLRIAALQRGISPAVIISCHYVHVYILYVFAIIGRIEWPIAYAMTAIVWGIAFALYAPPRAD